jgi:hypothetical protein
MLISIDSRNIIHLTYKHETKHTCSVTPDVNLFWEAVSSCKRKLTWYPVPFRGKCAVNDLYAKLIVLESS